MSLETGTVAPADSGTAPDSTVAVPSGSTAAAPVNDWFSALDEGTRKTVDAKGWKTPQDALTGALKSQSEMMRELTDVKSKSIVPPSDDAKPEDVTAFYRKLGMPEKADGYKFELPKDIPENFPYDAKAADKFKVWAHNAGLPPKQAQLLHDQFVKDTASGFIARQEAEQQSVNQAHEALVKTWGDPSSETYKRNQELANRTLRQSGGTELLTELKGIGALGPNGEVKTPALANMLAKIGEKMFAEDALFGGPTRGPNPFSKEAENMTEQGRIIRNDPDHARALIRAAGIDPQAYGL